MIGEFALIAVLGLAFIHVIAGKLRFLEGTPRSRWLSVVGGVSVAYVFMHLLPELSEGQSVLSEALEGDSPFWKAMCILSRCWGWWSSLDWIERRC